MDGPILEGGDLLWSREIAQLDLNIRMSPREESNNPRTVEKVGPQGTAHNKLANLTAARSLDRAGGPFGLREDCPSFRKEYSASVRQLDAPRCSMEERRLQLVLKAPNLLAQGRLRDVESRRRSPKMTFLGDRQEVAQVSQLHYGRTHITNV